jgi:hypothetical protein
MNKKIYLLLIIVVTIVLSFFVYGRDQRNSPAVQTWEYKSLIIGRGALTSNGEFTVWGEITGEKMKQLPPPVSVPAKAQELGMQGWELISVVPVSNHVGNETAGFTSQIIYSFKRPK